MILHESCLVTIAVVKTSNILITFGLFQFSRAMEDVEVTICRYFH